MHATRQRILDVSLELFSQKGFSAVSIRDICKQVRIKESSVYYHFKNKQAIFDELLYCFEKTATAMMAQLERGCMDHGGLPKAGFYEPVCHAFFEDYLMDPFCNKVLRLLLIEQFSSEAIRAQYDRWIYTEPLHIQSKVFAALMARGVIKEADSAYLALKYYAPIFFFAQRWLFSGTLSAGRKDAFRAQAYSHIREFFREIEGTQWQTS